MPEADVWLDSETSGALIPMGMWCGTQRPTQAERKQGCVCGYKSGECTRRNATEKSCQKWCKQKYCLVKGAF